MSLFGWIGRLFSRDEARQEPESGPVVLSDDLRSRPAFTGSSAFESGVIREIRNAMTPPDPPEAADPPTIRVSGKRVTGPRPPEPPPEEPPPPTRVRHPFDEDDEPVATPVDWEGLYKFATSRDDVLSTDILRYFDAVGIMPIVGVNDPAMREKLKHPSHFGWAPSANHVETRGGGGNPTLSGMRMWRLEPPRGSQSGVGQNVILTETGEIFVETAGPWGTTWMHRAENGTVTCREHRLGPVRPPQTRQRSSTGVPAA